MAKFNPYDVQIQNSLQIQNRLKFQYPLYRFESNWRFRMDLREIEGPAHYEVKTALILQNLGQDRFLVNKARNHAKNSTR